MSRFLSSLARSSARHPWRTVAVWLVVLVALFSYAGKLDGQYVDDFRLPGSDAQAAAALLGVSSPVQAGGTAPVVLAVEDGSLGAAAAAAAIHETLDEVAGLDHVVA